MHSLVRNCIKDCKVVKEKVKQMLILLSYGKSLLMLPPILSNSAQNKEKWKDIYLASLAGVRLCFPMESVSQSINQSINQLP